MRQFTNFVKPHALTFGVNHHTQRLLREAYQPPPSPAAPKPYRLDLKQILPLERYAKIVSDRAMMFHVAGDTGGVADPQRQKDVASRMARDLVSSKVRPPAFFYHLGDVAYYYGGASDYYGQFYDPYAFYDAPIFAIAGNHDGSVDPALPGSPPLAAFVNNFCAPQPVHRQESGDSGRMAMTQPHVYWTLETPFATLIGLYTNVPEGGQVDVEQAMWFTAELEAAPKDKAVIVACHHPPYSADLGHGGSVYMQRFFDTAFKTAGVVPHMVLSGHCHNYQRFERKLEGGVLPYVVAGGGGFWSLAQLPTIEGKRIPLPYTSSEPDVALRAFEDQQHGYLRLMVTPTKIFGEYVAVAGQNTAWSRPHKLSDAFTFHWATRKMEVG